MQNMEILLGFLAGIALPVQTGVNARLRARVGSPYNASLVSFLSAFVFLLFLNCAAGGGVALPFGSMLREPAWIWTGGICGVIFLTGNILLLSRLGGVQTVVLPVMGQILMGLLIDGAGLFYSARSPITILRVIGACLVLAGVLIISLAKASAPKCEARSPKAAANLWMWRIFGAAAGMLSAVQTAVNGYLAKAVLSPVKASLMSFAVGIAFLAAICIFDRAKHGRNAEPHAHTPWWTWLGGVLGGIYILANIWLSGRAGTGMTVIILLTGAAAGGLAVDHFGMFGASKDPINAKKLLGAALMTGGAVCIRLF